ncbi:MAG: peptide/nickel transport system ATP-binding protein [Phycisphaerales bacterium]|jgi:peptide/nickel transport system ATP-binding protein
MSVPNKAAADRPGAEQPLLEVRNLALSFGPKKGPVKKAVDGVSWSVYSGQTLAVVGESGCGKSVTAMSVLRLLPSPPAHYEQGEILFRTAMGGETPSTVNLLGLEERYIRQIRGGEIAMIFQEPMTSLNPVYSIGDQLTESIRLHRKVNKKQANDIAIEALTAVGITNPGERLRAFPHEFSGGMRQRAMIAMALACEPELLLADEPTTALDVTIQAQILDLIGDLRRTRNLGVVLITHDLGVVAERADVVCVMYAGRVVEFAGVKDLFENPRHPYTKGLIECIPKLGERHERLNTVADSVRDPEAFDVTDQSGQTLRGWWPWHSAPGSVQPVEGPGADSRLVQIGKDHWVNVWRTPEATDLPDRPLRLTNRSVAPRPRRAERA